MLTRRSVLLLIFTFVLQITGFAGEDRYAAVAFSPRTGKFGSVKGFASKSDAIDEARLRCGQPDAIVRWCRNSWLVLARSEKTRRGYGYGFAWGKDMDEARAEARANCLEHNDEANIVLCISAYR